MRNEIKFTRKIELDGNLYLRLLDLQDQDRFFEAVVENQAYFSKFDFLAPKFNSILEVQLAIEDFLQKQNSLQGAQYGIWLDPTFFGLLKINKINWEELCADVGYWLTESGSGRGFARAALKAIVENCWNHLNLETLTANTAVSNKKSHALLESLGFERIRRVKDAVVIDGKSVDDYVYQIRRK